MHVGWAYSQHVRTHHILTKLGAVLLASAMSLGCLSHSHVIPRAELAALAQTDPQVRGQHVRVVQNLSTASEPPAAPPTTAESRVSVGVHVGVPVRTTRVHTSHGGHSSGGLAHSSAKASADRSAFWVLAAVAVAVGLAATEGARFDGWVGLHPMHPVHLYGWDGSYTWMPLAHITPETAAWSRRALVREGEGPWQRLARAPLDRSGWTYSMLLGSGEMPVDNERARGFISHIQLGRFFSQEVGLLFDIGLGWATDQNGDTISDSRNALELEYFPVAMSVLHLGLFGQMGIGARLDDSAGSTDRRGFFFGGGGLAQLELTTRLAITARAGLTMIYGAPTSDLTLGLSIY